MSYLLCAVNKQWWSRILGGSIVFGAMLLSAFIFTNPAHAAPSACLVGNGDSVGYTYHPTNCFEGAGVDLTPNEVGSATYYDGTGSTYQYRAIKGDGFIRRAAKGSGTGVWSSGSGVTKLTQGTDYVYYSKADYDKEMQENAGEQAYADTGFNALDPVLSGDFKSKLKDVSCHAGDCAAVYDTAWKNALNECFTSSANLEEDQTRGSDEQTEANHKSKFANCLAGKLNGVTKQDILNKLNASNVNLTSIYDNASEASSNASDDSNDNNSNDETSCGIDGIGWLICPVMTFLAEVTDTAFSFLATTFLETQSSVIDSNPVRTAWGAMRNIANIAFVIAFLFIIYSQLTGAGISNYGVKKMLPRVIIAAILVNLSFIICQLAVDISNLLGYSMKALLDGGLGAIQGDVAGQGASTGQQVLQSLSAGALIVGIIAGGVALILAVSVPVLLAALLALFLIVLILVGRTALIVVLTIISPLAFVAFLLPNTEQWFKKWYKMFFALLMVFPIIGVVFGASSLAANVINDAAIANDQEMMQVVALGVASIPLFVVPSLLKGSLNAAGALGAKLSGASGKIAAKTGKMGLANQKRRGASIEGRMANNRMVNSKNRFARGLGRSASFVGGYRNRQAFKRSNTESETARAQEEALSTAIDQGKIKANPRQQAAAAASISKRENEEVANQLTLFKSQHGATGIEQAQEGLAEAIAKGDVVKARAMQQYLLGAGSKGMSALDQTYSSSQLSPTMHKELGGDALAAGVKSKNAAMDAMFTQGGDYNAHKASAATYSGLSDAEMATQSKETLQAAAASGALGSEQAQRILDNQTLQPKGSARAVLDQEVAYGSYTENVAAGSKPQNNQPQQSKPAQSSTEIHVDHSGRQTPNGATENYHDRMSK